MLLLHDGDDELVPWTNSRAILEARPDAALVTTRGLGHQQILTDRDTVARVAKFLSG